MSLTTYFTHRKKKWKHFIHLAPAKIHFRIMIVSLLFSNLSRVKYLSLINPAELKDHLNQLQVYDFRHRTCTPWRANINYYERSFRAYGLVFKIPIREIVDQVPLHRDCQRTK